MIRKLAIVSHFMKNVFKILSVEAEFALKYSKAFFCYRDCDLREFLFEKYHRLPVQSILRVRFLTQQRKVTFQTSFGNGDERGEGIGGVANVLFDISF